jgi:hypothetical protein
VVYPVVFFKLDLWFQKNSIVNYPLSGRKKKYPNLLPILGTWNMAVTDTSDWCGLIKAKKSNATGIIIFGC